MHQSTARLVRSSAARPNGATQATSAAVVEIQDVGWKALKNSVTQTASRLLVAVSRLGAAAMIVRTFGRGTFGEYSLLFGILTIAEWMLDFGTTDAFVRDICAQPGQRLHLLRTLTALRVVQIPAAFGLLLGIVAVMGHSARLVEAGAVLGIGLVFFAGVLVYRVLFWASLTIERDATGELLSTLVMLPLIALTAYLGGGIVALAACHVFSRAVYLGVGAVLGNSSYRLSVGGVTRGDVNWGLRSSSAIGLAGFVVVLYETIDILLLSRVGGVSQLAFYSGAQKFVWPLFMAQQAMAATLYPIAASYWPNLRSAFDRACQRGLETGAIVAGLAVCSPLAAAEFYMRLLGRDLSPGAPALRVLSLLCLVKCVSFTLGPMLYVVHKQKQMLKVVSVAVVAKTVAIAALTPAFGYMGVAWAVLGVEICFGAVPAVWLVQNATGYRVEWGGPIKIVGVTFAAAAGARLLAPFSMVLAAGAAPVLFVALIFGFRIVSFSDMRSLLQRRRS